MPRERPSSPCARLGQITITVAKILENTSTLADMVKNVWDIMTSNPLLLVFICASLVTLGFSFYRKAKRAARG